MSRFANLADKSRDSANAPDPSGGRAAGFGSSPSCADMVPALVPSRIGRKAIAAYFSLEMSLAMHVCARKRGLSLQALMGEAFDDVLRKYGESPIGG
ncbi:ribbon-helix-helix domain-containing protein [Telmatospirillum sp.]|uniref:ribbon-helix-helix domain-containing protein n=1 Tax=Telmatospirillum sp. TaxID=2079197 RepID=UPI002846D675|nr:ribbon-helix-helix domain-containing protein [Telmatospirillum sp.]MDR3436023.1 hypothetical protein [Telmatospirillum sp.]